MLSQWEQRALADIEQALRSEAPDLDGRLRDFRARAATRHLILVAVVTVGLALLGIAFALRNADALLVSALFLLAAASWATVCAFALAARRRARR